MYNSCWIADHALLVGRIWSFPPPHHQCWYESYAPDVLKVCYTSLGNKHILFKELTGSHFKPAVLSLLWIKCYKITHQFRGLEGDRVLENFFRKHQLQSFQDSSHHFFAFLIKYNAQYYNSNLNHTNVRTTGVVVSIESVHASFKK